uniref:Filaggrin-like n=1 Tax=Camelus bactrianus TaxID=9837 RepID=A0A9W3ENX4_CAMBA
MSSLLENITAIIDLFHQYSKTDKETETLSKKELKELLEVEFRPILKNPDDPDTADVFMHILDIDHDKKIDFTEFFLMVFKLAQAYYNSTRRQNFHTSGQKQKKYRHHHEDEEDVIEEEDKEEKKRKSSHSTSSDGKEKDRSKSPRGRGRNRHGSHSGSGGRRGVRVTSGHTHGYAKKSRGENIRRSSSTELKERSRNLSVSPNTGYEGNEDEYHYENKSTVRAKSGTPRYVDSYQESEETIDTTTDFQLEKQRNRRTPDIKSKEKITFIERNINDTIKDSKIRYENPSPPLTNIRNEGYTTSEDTDSEGRSEDSHSYHQSASENKIEHEENTSHSQDQREFSRGRDSVHAESGSSAA